MPLIARQRSRLAVLAVLALVGSLLAVSAVPAVAADHDMADKKAEYSACVGAAMEDAGFADMRGSFAEDAANCLSHYGITQGTSDGVYSPKRVVDRRQMALFLSRAAGPAGIELPMASDQMLSDIADLGDGDQDAINQMADLGIMMPRSDGVFDPGGVVTRADMAVHLAAFLSHAITGPGGTDIEDLTGDDESGDTPFTDIDGVTVAAHKAIRDIFELGVTTGTSATEFSPDAPVSRDQMAAFIARALGHTNARPAGISAQGPANADTNDSVTLSVSVRDAMGHQPVPDALVAAITSTTPDEAFDDEGACVDDKSDGDCTISTSNEATDPDGNAEISVDTPMEAGTLTVWVWTGESGDKFDADTTDRATLEIDAALPPTQTIITDDVKENADFLKFGDTVTYTFQVANTDDDPVGKADAEVVVKATIEDVSATLDADGNPTAGDTARRDDVETTVTTHKTDGSGMFQISFTADDPSAGETNRHDRVRLLLELSGATYGMSSKANDQGTDTPGAGLETIEIHWADDAPVATTLTLSQAVNYHEVDAAGVGNSLMATLVDQYGDPIRGQKVTVWSDAVNTAATATDAAIRQGLGGSTDATAGSASAPADHRTTNRNGVATKRYTRGVATAAVESLDANYVKVNGNCRDILTDCAESDDGTAVDADAVNHYWAVRATASLASSDVLVIDTDNNSVVVSAGTATVVTYKAGDYFTVDGNSATMEDFEKDLSLPVTGGQTTADTLTVTINTASGINTFALVNGT